MADHEEEQLRLELCTFEDDLPKLTDTEINNIQDSHEWYYFDLQTKDGNELAVRYLIKDTCIDDINPSISLEFTSEANRKKVERIKVYKQDDFKIERMDDDEGVIIRIGTNQIKIYKDQNNNIEKYELILKFDEFDMELECTHIQRGFKLYENRGYFTKKSKNDLYVCVVFPAPRMQIEGRLVIDQLPIKLKGEGYHDHTWGTTSLVFSHKEWHWGRIYTDKFTALFAEVFPSHDFSGKLKFLYYAKAGSTRPELESELTITPGEWKRKFMWEFPFVIKFPRELSIKCPKINFAIKTRFSGILKLIKIYIRLKIDADFIENDKQFPGIGWVEYIKMPALIPRCLMKLSARIKLKKWRKK